MLKAFLAVLCALALCAPVAVAASDSSAPDLDPAASLALPAAEAPVAEPAPENIDPAAGLAFAAGTPLCSQVHGTFCRQEGATQICSAPPFTRVCECQAFSWNCSF